MVFDARPSVEHRWPYAWRRLFVGVLVALVWALAPARLAAAATAASASDWPTFLHDPGRTAASADSTFSPTNAAKLTRAWAFATNGVVAASSTVVGGTVYVGSWDGFEYALDVVTGNPKWRTFLGITSGGPSCAEPPVAGVSSVAAVEDGVVYVGGGDAYWYALDANTGGVLWRVFTGDNSALGGHYNWSSPLLYNGYAYIGIASLGDCPLVQGELLQVSLSTHQVVNTFKVVPDGQTGGGIWTSPSVDPASNTVYVTTGNTYDANLAFSQSIIALDGTALALKGSWTVPPASAVPDSDWGTTPTVFDDASGRHLVAAINKNGVAYAFNRNDVSSGPVWQRQIAVGGECPICGNGSVSSGAFGNGRLYLAGGNTVINGVAAQGSVRALDPATGAIIWEHPAPAPILGALAYVNRLVVDGTGSTVEVLDAGSGTALWTYTTGARIYAAPSVAEGTLFAASEDHNVYAFTAPTSAPNDHLVLATAAPSPTAGAAFSFTVTAVDQFGSTDAGYAGTLHFVSTDTSPGVLLPPDSTLTTGQGTFSATLERAGQQTITATDTVNASITGSLTVTVGAAAGTRFGVTTTTATPTAGVAFPFTVTALDPAGNTDSSYSGTLHFISTDPSPGVSLPPDATLTGGQGQFSATLDRAGQQTITATDTVKTSVTGTLGVQVSPAAAAKLSLTAPSSATAGRPFSVTVTLTDQFGNIASGYRGTVHFSSSDVAAQMLGDLPADYAFTSADAGIHMFAVTLITIGSQTVAVADTVNGTLTSTSPPITVSLI
jgi:outer membrane protein assembly factor BamB